MPTKPVLTIVEWASDATWTIGPKVTQANKADYAGIAPQGHIPGIDNPSTANEQNDYQNRMSLVAAWVMQGSNSKLLSAHVVEANASGCIGAACIDVGGTTSNQPPAVFASNTGTNSASILASSGINDGIRSEAVSLFAMRALSRGQIGSSSFYTAEVDGTWDDTINPAGQAGGLRILSNNDELLAPAPPAQHPLNSRGLFVRNANGVAVEVVGNAAAGVHSDDVAMNVRNFGLLGDGIRVNTQAGPEPIGGHGVIAFGGQAFFDAGVPLNSFAAGTGLIGRGGLADPAGDGLEFGDQSKSGDGVFGFAGIPNPAFGGGFNAAGAAIRGVSESTVAGISYAGWFQRVVPGIGAVNIGGAVVRVEASKESTSIVGLEASTGHGDCIRATSFGGTVLALKAQESDNTVGLFGAHLNLDNGLDDINPSTPVNGDFWYRRTSHPSAGSSFYLKFKTLSDQRFIPHFHFPPIRHQIVDHTGSPVTSLNNTDEATLFGGTFSFDTRSIPESSAIIAFRMYFRFRFTSGSPAPVEPFGDTCNIRLYDITLGGGSVVNRNITYSPHTLVDSTAGPWDDKSILLLYTVPAGGERDFQIRFLNLVSAGGDPQTNQIQDVQLEMYTWGA